MGISQLHEESLSYLDLERGYGPLMITSCRSHLRLFMRYLRGASKEVRLELRPKCSHDYLFTFQGKARLGRKGLMGVLRRPLTNAGLQREGVTLQTLRHSFPCLMLQTARGAVYPLFAQEPPTLSNAG